MTETIELATDAPAATGGPEAAYAGRTEPWYGPICVEGMTSGDGREFGVGKLTWQDPPLPLRWNKEDSHGGTPSTVAVNVGRIDRVWREGNQIMATGVFNLDEPDGMRAFSLVQGKFLRGISIDADSINSADVELVWGDGKDPADAKDTDVMSVLFGKPEKTIYHGGRIRAATLCDIPAFPEAFVVLGQAAVTAALEARIATVGDVIHTTATTDGPWDAAVAERNLPAKLEIAGLRAAYAYVDPSACSDGNCPKTAGKFIHHEVDDAGTVGPANLTACASGIGIIHGARGGTSIADDDRRAVYDHLAAHLRDAGRIPTPFLSNDVIVAAAFADDWRPPSDWFDDPVLNVPVALTITEAGRVYGHAALWNQCHIGSVGECVTPPQEHEYPYFMTGEVVCAGGERVPVGQITMGTGHAPLTVGASAAAEHYDNTGTAIADVSVGADQHGIWIAGALRRGASIAEVSALRAAGQVSGDWRRIAGQLRLVGLLAVNVPGFPIPRQRARVASGSVASLVAAGIMESHGPTEEQLQQAGMRALREQIMRRVGLPV